MDPKRQELHKMLDELPDGALRLAEQALKHCANPAETQFTIQQARDRVMATSMKRLEEQSKRAGHGFVAGFGGSTTTTPAGDFKSSMTAWDDGPVTYYQWRFRGHMFEIYERLELADAKNDATKNDAAKLMLTQRIVGPDGSEQVLTANIPVSHARGESIS